MKRLLTLVVFSVLLVVLVGAQNVFASVWDYAGDFDLSVPQTGGTGPTPSWFYYFDRSSFSGGLNFDGDYELGDNIGSVSGLNCYDEQPGGFYVICEPTSPTDPGVVHPLGFATGNSFGDTVIGFHSPQVGTYRVQGSFDRPSPSGNGICVAITKHNPADLGVGGTDQNISPDPLPSTCSIGIISGALVSPASTQSFDFEIDMTCGERLFFRTNPNGIDSGFDGTFLDIQINDIELRPQPGDACDDPSMAVGGEFIGVESTALILAGSQVTASWLIPLFVAGIGFAIVIARKY